MLPTYLRSLFSICLLTVLPASVFGALVSPQVGSQAFLLNDLSHNVSGTVTIVDDDTVRVDNFTYDGGGGAVYFYLGAIETDFAFETGLRIGSLLSDIVFDGTQGPLFVDLPTGQTLEGFQAFSVWCEARAVNFGSGTFLPVAVPEPAALGLVAWGALCLLRYRRRKRFETP